jgi:hypothetical protein
MKKSRIVSLLAIAFAVAASFASMAFRQPVAYIETEVEEVTLCLEVERPQGCVFQGETVCTIGDETFYDQQIVENPSQCLQPLFFNGNQ